MSEKIYNKLVRDNIPDVISSNGQSSVTRLLQGEEFMEKLVQKLDEELNEFRDAFDRYDDEEAIKELADVVEVIYAIVEEIGLDKESFEKIRQAKLTKNGGFSKHILLEKVID